MSLESIFVVKHFTVSTPFGSAPKGGPTGPAANPQPAKTQLPAHLVGPAAGPGGTSSKPPGGGIALTWLAGNSQWRVYDSDCLFTEDLMDPNYTVGGHPGDDDLVALATRLLKIAGDVAVIPYRGLDARRLLASGVLVDGMTDARLGPDLARGWRQSCVALWKSQPGAYRIHTGFAMDDDDVWTVHTWLVDEDGQVVDTWGLKYLYFGRPLSPDEEEKFCARYGRGR